MATTNQLAIHIIVNIYIGKTSQHFSQNVLSAKSYIKDYIYSKIEETHRNRIYYICMYVHTYNNLLEFNILTIYQTVFLHFV